MRIAAISPVVYPGDVEKNVQEIIRRMRTDVDLMLFPRLALTGATMGDPITHRDLTSRALEGLQALARHTGQAAVAVGLPYRKDGRLYDGTALLQNGQVLGVVKGENLSWMDLRWFSPGDASQRFTIAGQSVAVEQPADVVLMPRADACFSGTHAALQQQLAACPTTAVYACAGFGESTADHVYDGYTAIFRAGQMLGEGPRFSRSGGEAVSGPPLPFAPPVERDHSRLPFVPENLEEIVQMQVTGLATRLCDIRCRKVVVGVSGGLDSTLALLVAVRTFDWLGLSRDGIIGITMPGLATGARTRSNADALLQRLGVTALTIPIGPAVRQHFADIGQDESVCDVTYENAQARERTQILMDYANKANAIALGTGDLSEIALGFCTFGGDHMSMYNVNATVPKTLVRALCAYLGPQLGVEDICRDVLATPISPELTPDQKTEDILGSYELHDLFLWHYMQGATIEEMIAAAAAHFDQPEEQLALFLRRFHSQQFKRNAMPDGPQVTPVSLSPRGGWMAR